MPLSQEAESQHPRNFWDLLDACTLYEKNNQIWHGYQSMCEEYFAGRPRIMTRDLISVANLIRIMSSLPDRDFIVVFLQ